MNDGKARSRSAQMELQADESIAESDTDDGPTRNGFEGEN